MNEPLYEIENWRGGWYYKLGSRYTGPFKRRDSAVSAARLEVDPLQAPKSLSLRASLASQRPAYRSSESERRERPMSLGPMSLGMSFRIPGGEGHA